MTRRIVRTLVVLLGGCGLAMVTGVAGAGAAGAAPSTLSVGCWGGGYPTIGSAVAAASPGATIRVCPGTYHEDVVVPPSKPLSIVGLGNAVIDATGLDNGVQVLASNSQISGLTVENAIGEGILVQGAPGAPVSHVTISWNTVVHNDQGNPTGAPLTTSSYPECNGSAQAPGDCGEAIHLMVAANSWVTANHVSENSGGVLLTDEFGPTFGNVISFNDVTDNTLDCGITIAGHNPGAFVNGQPQPAAAGVFDNKVLFNSVSDNGVAGQGAGVLLATPLPGGGVYNNDVQGNSIWGNGLAGVTVHSHAPGQDLNGNTVAWNLIGTNNVDGDPDFFPSVDPSTTGVIVATVGPLSITVTHNLIANNVFGIWSMPAASVTGSSANLFFKVATPVFVAP